MVNNSTYWISQDGQKRSGYPQDVFTYAIKHNHDYVYEIRNNQLYMDYELTPDYIEFIKSLEEEC